MVLPEIFFDDFFDAFTDSYNGKYCFICDLDTDYSRWPKEAVDYFGMPSEYMYNVEEIWRNKISEDSRELYVSQINDLYEGKIPVFKLEYRVTNAKGEFVTVTGTAKIIRKNGHMKYMAGTLFNHEYQNVIDPITGLYTRTALMSKMAEFKEEKKAFYMLIIGIRNYFDINNSMGYATGNDVLKEISKYAMKVRDDCYIYRTDGAKFVFIIDAKIHDYTYVKNKFNEIREHLRNDFIFDGNHLYLEICGGVILNENMDMDVNAIYNSAQYALAKAKEEKKVELMNFNNSFFADNKKKLVMLNVIRKSILEDYAGFYLVYQPIVSANEHKVVGMESLLRWKNDEYGNVPPNEFIPWLEQDPIFCDLGYWILKQAMTDTMEIIQKNPDFVVNVNLAYPQLQRADFNSNLHKIVNEVGFPPENLKLELTERCRLMDMDLLRNEMVFFKSSHMQTALDDFGTGYSALNLLIALPVDQIKIDKTFVDDIDKDVPKQCLLRAITTCAIELGKKVCVEGIENEYMLEYITENFPVTSFQGYYFSKPITIEEFKETFV